MTTDPSLHPPSTLLIGAAGTGKTTSVTTLFEAGLRVRMLATEPTAPNRVLEECKKRSISTEGFDWHFVSPSIPQWSGLIDAAQKVNTLNLKQLADLTSGIAKPDGTQFIAFLNACNSFVSAKTGEVLGDVTSWGDDCAFVLDGLTGVNTMSRNLTVGLKPTPNPGEWGIMQNNILSMLQKLTADCKCFFVCIAHVERENDELTGIAKRTVSTLGAKLAPKIPPLFTTVVEARRDGTKFYWDTAAVGADTKNGDLDFSSELRPSFLPIVTVFRARKSTVAMAKPPLTVATPSSTQAA